MQSGSIHILVGIDFSESSVQAMNHALSLTEQLARPLYVLLAHCQRIRLDTHLPPKINAVSDFI